jgi:rhamnogalacturonyl hydrolase YesR
MGIQPKETVSIIRKVYKTQIKNLPTTSTRLSGRHEKILPTGWIRSVFFIGLMAFWESISDLQSLKAVLNWGEENDWLPGPHPRLADDHCAGQVYTELYLIYEDKKMIRPIQKTFDHMIADSNPGREEWYWCDALFMAPPVLARLAAATEDRRYLDFMNHLWWDTTELLYDKECALFFRDQRYIIQPDGTGPREKNGQKIFWSRGNAWVMAGIVRVLKFMPDDFHARQKFIQLFKEMAQAVSRLQQADGLWRSSLLDPEHFPARETSGSALFCYAIAWGINNEILDRGTYFAVVENVWQTLVDCVDQTGRLGWVQLPGDGARAVKKNDSMEYGSGAFLLAGSEMVKLQSKTFK